MLGMVTHNHPPNHGPRLQKVKPSLPAGLVLECAHCARRVTPSVLARAAGIEGDWSLMALGSRAGWCNVGLRASRCCELASALIQGPVKMRRGGKCKDEGSERGQAGIWLAFSLESTENIYFWWRLLFIWESFYFINAYFCLCKYQQGMVQDFARNILSNFNF